MPKMETENLPMMRGLGYKAGEARNPYSTSYSVGVGQGLFHKVKKEDDEDEDHEDHLSEFEKDQEYFSTLNVELTADHVPLGEILERLQSDEGNDRNNFIRLHAVTDSHSNISATLNVATLDLSTHSTFQQHISEIQDVLLNFKSDAPTSPNSTSSSLLSSPSFSPQVVPEVNSFLNNNILINIDGKSLSHCSAMSPQHSNHGYENMKSSPQECNLCNKMFGNASALAKHRLTHSDERKYLCTVCHKAFKRQDHLNGHLLTHRNKKPFECTADGCNKSYCDARSLRRHRENHHSSKDEKMVSPDSSVSSNVDMDEKSMGSDSFDSLRNSKPYKPGQDKDKALIKPELQALNILEKYIRNDKESFQNSSKLKPAAPTILHGPSQQSDVVVNMVECSICSRRFKNIPALNGHMRLHGGYYRKDNEKKQEIRIFQSEPMSNHTVSNNVKNLIEEKIIQKRKLEPVLTRTMGSSSDAKFQSLNVPSSSSSHTQCSTSVSGSSEPPYKRINQKPSALDNLVFPILPQPDTYKLLANLQNKQSEMGGFLPAQPLPNVPLPSSKCYNPVKTNDTHVKSAHMYNLLKVDNKHKTPRLGAEYQAVVPDLEIRTTEDKYGVLPRETQMWSPASSNDLSQSQIDVYIKFCLSSAVSVALTAESALQVLNWNNGDIMRATQEVVNGALSKQESPPAAWTPDHVDMFYEALCKHKKKFNKISDDIPGKSSKDCIEFYYFWKNLCREESQSFKSIISSVEDPEPNLLL
ncbi:uncharacterized protein LOC111711600 [Eurytemora carolleeae]|uniref:uncharacterized protein LOC111711600 n=1 Tax=Eurytemora carolleeae TaxID=1294199 RepID=UPI000C7830EB|nr:uncharacterized protein LOC111711600 [Eurytemora carolleeae]|eukprot:XP_023341766.1 uncharacterized protein LOC111711600 [Eurytemora affinis]